MAGVGYWEVGPICEDIGGLSCASVPLLCGGRERETKRENMENTETTQTHLAL